MDEENIPLRPSAITISHDASRGGVKALVSKVALEPFLVNIPRQGADKAGRGSTVLGLGLLCGSLDGRGSSLLSLALLAGFLLFLLALGIRRVGRVGRIRRIRRVGARIV